MMLTKRLGNLIRRVFVPRAKRGHEKPKPEEQVELREANEPEIDEAIDESFPASDPPALSLERDR